VLRSEYAYEEMTFVPGLLRHYQPSDHDLTVTCSYPFSNWVLRRPSIGRARPPHVFVTQNGDWPARASNSEYRFFRCEGLVCTNPDYYEHNRHRWNCRLIPNGVDVARFFPGPGQRDQFGLPTDRPIVLMVSALIASKRVNAGIEAVRHLPDVHLVVAGDGPLRDQVDAAAAKSLPGRFTRLSVAPEKMPLLYRSADVFLHLSMEESSSLAFVEAMACGTPVVGHDSPRMRYVAGDGEYLLDTRDLQAVAQHIRLACNASSSQAQDRSKRAAAFSWINIAAKYRQFFQEIVSG
jgi:glycosyltransferase involved in cell wall biosynthesis